MKNTSQIVLFIVAVVIAVVIKILVHQQEILSERVLDAQVNYDAPPEQMILYDRQEQVKVVVRGPLGDISRLGPYAVEVQATLPAPIVRPGPREIVLRPQDVRFTVSGDFEVLSIEPNRFSVQLEEEIERQVPIIVELIGEPAAGARPGKPIPRPPQATIRGPRSKVERLREVPARISLEGHARTFEDQISLATTDPYVKVQAPTVVTVTVPMEEPELSISIRDLQDTSPDGGEP
ncbi:MAG: CdaR family protein [Acidobacteriota bacterium]